MLDDHDNKFDKEYFRLNEAQKEAVDTIEGPVLVVAGPGTGKTQIIAMRIANILKKTDISASDILCLTFTETGVAAMRERLLSIIGTEAYYVNIYTFHGFCNDVILTFPEKFAFTRNLIQLDDIRRVRIIRDVIDEFDSDSNKYHLIPFYDKYSNQKEIISKIQDLKREGIKPVKLIKFSKQGIKRLEENPDINPRTKKPKGAWTKEYKTYEKTKELAEIYEKYSARLEEEGYYDYEDMISFVTNVLERDPELLAYYQEKFLYTLVDEYQDTNGSQNQIIKLLGSPVEGINSPNIFAVGDDDQAIYRFQGANVENLQFFRKQFNDVKIITLTINYRSTQLILDASSDVVANNTQRLVNYIPGLSKDLKAGVDKKDSLVEVYGFEREEYEHNFLINKIKELASAGVKYSDITILYRRHSDAEEVGELLLKSDIPIKLAAGINILDEKIVQMFLNLLRLLSMEPSKDSFLLYQVMSYEFLNINRLDLFKLTRYVSKNRMDFWDVLLDKDRLKEIDLSNKEKLLGFISNLTGWKALSNNLPLRTFVEKLAMDTGYINYVFSGRSNLEDINSVKSFFEYVKEVSKSNRSITIDEFLDELKVLEENGFAIKEKELDINSNGVNLMTAHKSKGLEFEHVFIINCYDGNWGGRRPRNKIKLPLELFVDSDVDEKVDNETEDDRRLVYVAMTRAKQRLYITYSKEYPSGNATKVVAPSQFISEIQADRVEHPDTDAYSTSTEEHMKFLLTPRERLEYTEQEADYLRSIIESFKLSPSSLNTYIKCPLRFKYDYLLRLPKPDEQSLILGNAIHYSLEMYLRAKQKQKDVDIDYLITAFNSKLSSEDIDEDMRSRVKLEGEYVLNNYYEHYQGQFSLPLEIEYGFYGHGIVLDMEGTEPIELTGKLDKVELISKEQNTVKVVDYKTSKPKSQNEIKGETKSSDGSIYRQLVFYKLLGDLDPQFRRDRISPRYVIKQVEVDFLKPNSSGKYKRECFEIENNEVENLKQEIVDVMNRIRNLEFDGSEQYPLCGECEYCKSEL